jgi:hypothetical protein
MVLIVGFLLFVAAIGFVFYLFLYREIPGAVEMRLGTLEEIPGDIDQWKADEESDAGKAAAAKGLKREVRLYFDEKRGVLGSGAFVRQARYRNRATNEITGVDPDELIKRKRIRKD